MASYNTSANVVLTMNGKQANNIMDSLKSKAEELRSKIDAAASAGDKFTMSKYQRELNSTNRLMDQLTGAAFKVDEVLSRLNTASPKELSRALKQLKNELNGIERGTKAWDDHIQKIKQVRAELKNINAAMHEQQTLWQRFNNWLNNCQASILAFGAAITGLIMAGRKAVNAFAEMDEQLANTRKYTGMCEDDVLKLNEAFKRMDTRTPREQLNELAQEAGRLGKNTLESVQGYVEAAEIINVALVDLGAGATQTIAKLTNIFGVEEMLGTKDAMLAVGSTVNVLSQNCTASKPYLVDFAQRMAGIGSQAGLTIPQILAFGAVLDANGQKVEMSATALQKVIMNLANKNHEFAATVGLDAQILNETLKHSAKDGLLMFLEALQKMGQNVGFENATMTLAPAFKEMGLDAARVSQVLSTLAMHLDEVKWQIGEADKAFSEATSATKEYEIFNNTVQAGLDKAKNRVHELAVELGEKLQPAMKLFMTSSTFALKVLSGMVDFFIKFRKEITAAVTAFAAYKVVMMVYTSHTKMAAAATTIFHKALSLMKGVLPAIKLLITPLINAVQYFTNGLKVNYAMQERWRKSLEAMKFSTWTGLILAFAASIGTLVSKYNDNIRKLREQREEMARLQEEATNYSTKAVEAYSKEIFKLQALYDAATNEANSREERIKAAKALQKLYPEIFAQYSAEEIMLRKAETAYKDLTTAIIKKAEAQAAAELYKDNFKKILEYDVRINQVQDKENDARNELNAIEKRNEQRRRDTKKNKKAESMVGALVMNQTGGAGGTSQDGRGNMESTSNAREAIETQVAEKKKLNNEKEIFKKANDLILSRFKDDKEFQSNMLGDDDALQETKTSFTSHPHTPAAPSSGGGGGHSVGTTDKFEKEKEWREQQEALAQIAYNSGVTDYETYTKTMDSIAVQFYSKQLEHTDLGETERLKIQAQYHEAVAKQDENARKLKLQEIENEYAEQGCTLKQNYVDGLISKQTYDLKTQEAEMAHQRRLSKCQEIGEEERLKAQDKYNDLLLKNKEKANKKYLEYIQLLYKAAKEYQDKLDKVKQEVFGLNKSERDAQYAVELDLLNTVYQGELKAAQDNAGEKLRIEKAYQEALKELREEYMQDPESSGGFKGAIEKAAAWLESKGGKALTGTMSTLTSGMSSIFSQLTSSMQADLEMQTAAINRRYDSEISRAEGNTYKVAQLEKRKEAEIAAAKNEANRKMFAMQVIQAIAQTAQNALAAFGSAANVPLVGYILAPIAAAMAVAAGAIQIANIKKQQQAAQSQGYEQGGFTRPGRKDEPAGIVHAGEWVAPQSLVQNPQTRPLIDTLEQARRGNTRAAISALDVSRAITAPMALAAAIPGAAAGEQSARTGTTTQSSDTSLQKTISRLADRLDQPFITVNSVTGEAGMNKVQRDYERLMANKSPRRKSKS